MDKIVGYIDLTPTPTEYRNICMGLSESIVGDVPQKRKESVRKILSSIVEISAYLGQKDAQKVKEIISYLTR